MLNNTPFLGIFGYFYSYLMTKINNKNAPYIHHHLPIHP
ncbi:hypothetical protein EJK55_0340 [Moraxella catarrhalis]|uniref:Uncharacterized protein n=1 Tax=Moraxella catarrhalis TaxID=480 RepID=A0A198Y0Q1_MORCA|nr:hypothetical protein MCR_0636 [Moraxella catarrhalis BBH18]AZQ86560.1 hypothetical protein EJK52_0670 [Moraxella catarrhalis]EKF84166.1 hypothetical protein MCRH_0694 [Moraxella catarrhalis RH4]AZQ89726.1 hypothetical protein EJK50_0666 [Moraxella catarrhalis]AZQ92184.1 hypothetical protein EJK51_0668 [Moraxella catarrhalis]